MHISYVFQCEEVRFMVRFSSQAKDHVLSIYHPDNSINTRIPDQTDSVIMYASVPTKGIRILYTYVGDIFWLDVIAWTV